MINGNLSVPVNWYAEQLPDKSLCAHAVATVDGIRYEFKVTIPAEKVAQIVARIAARNPYGAVDEFGLFKSLRRKLKKGVLGKALNFVKQATLLPAAGKLAGIVSKATGLPIGPEQLSKAYDLAGAIMKGSPKALKIAASIAKGAAMGLPQARAAMMGLQLAGRYIPTVKRVTDRFGEAPVIDAQPYGWAPQGWPAPQARGGLMLPMVAGSC